MGVDAVIRLAQVPPPDVLTRLQLKFREDWPVEIHYGSTGWPYLDDLGEVCTMQRYYGPGYERGHWPYIRRVIEWLHANAESPVLYGSDSMDSWPEVTPERIEEIQATWDEFGTSRYDRD